MCEDWLTALNALNGEADAITEAYLSQDYLVDDLQLRYQLWIGAAVNLLTSVKESQLGNRLGVNEDEFALQLSIELTPEAWYRSFERQRYALRRAGDALCQFGT